MYLRIYFGKKCALTVHNNAYRNILLRRKHNLINICAKIHELAPLADAAAAAPPAAEAAAALPPARSDRNAR